MKEAFERGKRPRFHRGKLYILMELYMKIFRYLFPLIRLVRQYGFISFSHMTHNTSGPDLNLHSFNDHGIFTIEELNELSTVVKTPASLGTTSKYQKFK